MIIVSGTLSPAYSLEVDRSEEMLCEQKKVDGMASNDSVFKSVRAFVSTNTLAYHNRDSCVVLFFQQQSAIKTLD